MNAYKFEVGDVVKAGTEFAGTAVDVDGDVVTVENRDGETAEYEHGDLKHAI